MPVGNVSSTPLPVSVSTRRPSESPLPKTGYGASPPTPRRAPGTELSVPADTLEVNGRMFGKGAKYGEVRPLMQGMTSEKAAKVAKNDGLDKIFFSDESGQAYVFYVEKAHLSGMQAGYVGRFNGKRVTIDAVDDESNTFIEGFTSVWRWMGTTLNNAFGSEASNRISGLMGTTFGTLIAAAALKTTTNPVPQNAIRTIAGTMETLRGGAMDAIWSLVRTSASVVIVMAGAVGALSLFAGLRGHFRQSDYSQLDMVTGHY